jgi:hypothetical protein
MKCSQNHNPLAQNGSDSAWGILSPIWAAQNITPLRTTWQNPQAWLEYNNTAFGVVVDRFRWEGGCIVEHVSYPVTTETSNDGLLKEFYSGIKERCFRPGFVQRRYSTEELNGSLAAFKKVQARAAAFVQHTLNEINYSLFLNDLALGTCLSFPQCTPVR